MKTLKKAAAALLAVALLAGALAGCGKTQATVPARNYVTVDGERVAIPWAMKIGDKEVSLDEYRYYYMTYRTQYGYGSDEASWAAENGEFLRDAVEEAILQQYALESLFEEHNVKMTAEETAQWEEEFAALKANYTDTSASDSASAAADGEKALAEAMKANFYTDDVLKTMYRVNTLLYDLYDALYAKGGTFALTAEEMLGSFVHVQHILVDDEATANEVLEKARAGEDFAALMTQYNTDTGEGEDGYVFTTGQMVEAFETASFALAEGEISEIIPTTYGYHIIKRLPLDAAYIDEHYDELNDRNSDFIALVEERMGTLTVTYNDTMQKLIDNEALDAALVNYYESADQSESQG